MMTTYEFAEAVGRKEMMAQLEIGQTAFSNAVVRGRFPAAWYEVGRSLASDVGVECPPELFSQKGVSVSLKEAS
jgi:hypothetical protein